MTDPVLAISEALHQFNGHDRVWTDCASCWTTAEVAVAALKAHPAALAALLDSSPDVHRYAVGSSAAEAEPETEWLYEVRT